MNGAQTAGLLQIVTAITTGELTPEAGRLVISSSFPLLDDGLVARLVKELGKGKPPVADPSPPKAPEGQINAPEAPAKALESPEGAKALCQCKGLTKANKGIPKGEELAKVLKKYFAKQKREILASLKHKAKALPKKFVPLKAWDRELYTESQPVIEMYLAKQYKAAGADIVARTGISPDVFNVTNPKLKEAVHKLTLRFCEETNATTSTELNKALEDLRESFAEGLGEGKR